MSKQKSFRYGVLSLDKVRELYLNKRSVVVLFGKEISTKNNYLDLLMSTDFKCCKCGLEGLFFAVENHFNEKDKTKARLTLYNKKQFFNIDHIIPKSKGGANCLSNYQIMCRSCNCKKDNKITLSTLIKGKFKDQSKPFYKIRKALRNKSRKVKSSLEKVGVLITLKSEIRHFKDFFLNLDKKFRKKLNRCDNNLRRLKNLIRKNGFVVTLDNETKHNKLFGPLRKKFRKKRNYYKHDYFRVRNSIRRIGIFNTLKNSIKRRIFGVVEFFYG